MMPKGETRQLPDPKKLTLTVGVERWLNQEEFPVYLFPRIIENAFKAEPDTCFDGGNDKYFFTFVSCEQKFFAALNEIGGLTIMLPEEY
jgi:hypothetical protein